MNRGKVKALKMDNKIKREIHILQMFHHPHIIRLYEVIETATDVFMFIEYVSGGELFDLIVQKGKLEEREARRFFQQIISGVQYCHHHRVVHRDLKPENLLLDGNGNVKIADFGLSNIMEDGAFLQTSCGSPNYAAPEVISGSMYSGQEIDIWSCGVILYALVVGKLPFDEDYIPTLFQKIRNGIYTIPPFVSGACADLIRRLLDVNPITRITVVEVKQHPWFVVDLPLYLKEDSAFLSRAYTNSANLDQSIVSILVQRSGLPLNEVMRKLKSDTNNDILVAYNLLLDNSPNKGVRVSLSGNHLLADEDVLKGKDSLTDSVREMATSPPMNLREEGSLIPVPGVNRVNNVVMQTSAGSLGGNLANSMDLGDDDDDDDDSKFRGPAFGTSVPALGRFGGRDATHNILADEDDGKNRALSKTWYLGLLTEKQPDAVMAECYRVLRLCEYEWKPITKFHIRVRPVLRRNRAMSVKKRRSLFGAQKRDLEGHELSGRSNDNVKFDLQLYRVSATQSLLDFKRISDEGTIMGYLVTCQLILSCLNLK